MSPTSAARRLTAADEFAALEELHRLGCTDGLPVVAPLPERVERMVLATGFEPDLDFGPMGPSDGACTVEMIAISAVMAGCTPDHAPVVVAAVRAILRPEFDLTEVQATTHSIAPFIVVNGPIRLAAGVHSGFGALGPGHRANASIGRAVRLAMINIGGGRSGSSDMALLGHPGKFTCCLAEDEESSPLPPLHTARGFGAEDSAVTVLGTEAPHSVIGRTDADDPTSADRLLNSLAAGFSSLTTNNATVGVGQAAVVLNPDHAIALATAGHTRETISAAIFERAANYGRDIARTASPRVAAVDLDGRYPCFESPDDILVLVAGGEGMYSVVLPSWCAGPHNNRAVTVAVEIDQACEVPYPATILSAPVDTGQLRRVDDTAPVIVALGANFGISDRFADAVAKIHPDIRFVSAPYVESDEARRVRGLNGGRLRGPAMAPQIDEDQHASWNHAHAAILRDLPDDIATLAPHLEWVQTISAGVDHLDLDAMSAAGIRLTNASGLASKSISEFVLARLLQVWKQLRTLDQGQDRHEWGKGHGIEVAGKTVGIAGLGAIGRNIAKRLRAFDIEVLAARASANAGDTDPDVDELYPASDLHGMLARCDAVVACLPTTEQTVDLFDQRAFAAMRPGSIFCNVGRGAQVVEDDLIAALETGHVGAAILDVTRIEPLPPEDPLWSAPNLYLSPHASVSLDRYVDNLETLIVDNLRRFVAGEKLINEVDLSAR